MNPKALAQIVILLLLLYAVPIALLYAGRVQNPNRIDSSRRYVSPSAAAWFGTDGLGRDSFARTVYASGLSLKAASQSLVISFILALVLGGIAGFNKGTWSDWIISWAISIIYTIPFVLIAVALAAVIRPGIESAYILIGFLGWAAPARLFRAGVMQLRSSRHVLAERAYGMSEPKIFVRSVLPLAVLPPLLGLVYFVPELVAVDVGLSFFGLGAQPPTPTFGRLIYDGFGEIRLAWWISVMPAGIMMLYFYFLHQTADKLASILGRSPGLLHSD